MTESLYYKDAYLKEVWTKVVAVEGRKILTEKTIFFPKTQDQPGDTGTIDGIPVLGALKQGEDTWHMLEREHHLKPGDEVPLKLGWKNRNYSMRLHTAAHLLSQVLKKNFRLYANNIYADEEGAHLEFKEEIDLITMNKALELANELVQSGVDVDISIEPETGKQAACIGYLPRFNCDGLFAKDVKEVGAISLSGGGFKGEKFVVSINVEFL
ncbi:Alanyl-tRNA editing protein AlaX-M [uncultured archaeon]|nr:Alanyl-tRNA editing protein AlaX-M [uncultured archaeon]